VLTCAVLQHEKDNSATAIKFTGLNPAIFSAQCAVDDVQSGNFVSTSIDKLYIIYSESGSLRYAEICNDVTRLHD